MANAAAPMLRIGIVTVWRWICRQDNYGSLLQAWALQQALLRMGHAPEVLRLATDEEERYRETHASAWRYALRARCSLSKKRRRKYRVLALRAAHPRGFMAFARERLRLSAWNLSEGFGPERWKDYDAALAGSDQIWLDLTPEHFLASPGTPARRVAYAVSRPWQRDAEAFERAFRAWAPGLTALGIREREGVALCAALGRQGTHVADSVLLLEAACWRELMAAAPRSAVAYFSEAFPAALRRTLGARCARKGMRAAWVGMQGAEADIPAAFAAWPTPQEWVGLLAAADEIVTNSFHGLCFAILFERPFAVICPPDAARQMSLLRRLGLEAHRTEAAEEVEGILEREVDWRAVRAKLAAFREESLRFLREALGDDEGGRR